MQILIFKAMKRSFIILVSVILSSTLLLLNSCKKVLEEKPHSFLSPNNFYQNEEDAKTAINGVYSELYSWNMYLQPMWNLTVLDDDHVSGADWYLGTSGAGNPQGYWGIDGPWVGCYTMISRANTVLENVILIQENIDEEIKNRILGEAYFLRGWAYFQLVQLYGEVPLRLQSLSANPEANVPKAKVMEVYEAIIEDFKQAEVLLLPKSHEKSGESGRVNREVAKSFLAKTYLTIASGSLSPVNITVRGGATNSQQTYVKKVVAGLEGIDSQTYFELARDKALEVIESEEYKLVPDLKDLWSAAYRNKDEHMWMLQSLSGTTFVNQIHSYFSATSYFGRGAVWFTNNHYMDYAPNDKRILDVVAHNYVSNTGARYFYPSWEAAQYKVVNGLTYNNNGGTDDRAYVIKYADVAEPLVSNSDAYFPLLRYAEILLIYAEAANEASSTPTAKAYEYLNEVYNRATAQDAPAGMNKEQFRSFVLAERAREFVLEGIRRYDLIRWGIYLEVMNSIGMGQNNISKIRVQRNLLLPIPVSEMNSNKAIKDNNFGW